MKRILLAAALVASAFPARANTRFGFGMIVEVDPEGKKPQNKGLPSFTVFHEFRNLVDGREFYTRTYKITEKTRHGDRVYLLAGKVDMPAVAKASAGTAEWMIVELDACATDMLTAVKESYDYLVRKGLARGNKI